MGRTWAAMRVAALFLITVCGSLPAHACESCERVQLAPENPQRANVPRNIGRLDVTSAVDTATSFVIEMMRGLRLFSRFDVADGEVDITQQELGAAWEPGAIADISNGSGVIASPDELNVNVADYIAAYDAGETHDPVRMPNFRREHKWALTYRSDAADAISQPAQSDRFPGMNTTLDDSVVFGLRFEWEYGWTR